MRNYLFLLLLLPGVAMAQDHSADSAWFREHYVKHEYYIPMRDGIRLFTSVYMPVDSAGANHPILMTRTPYSCAPYGLEAYSGRYYRGYLMQYAREGYIFVTQDVRGAWMSEGQFVDIRPYNPHKKGTETDEASDTYDAIDWLVKHVPGNNGRVGVFGISYPGFYSTMAALSGHPALKAVSPQAPVTDWFQGDDFHHNGAFFIMDGFSFYTSFGLPRPKPTTVRPRGIRFQSDDNYDLYLKTGSLAHFAALMGDSVAFWKDLYAHPNYDAFWRARNDRQFLTDVKPAMMEVGGLFDAEDCFGAQNVYKAIATQSRGTDNRLVLGPWYHGEWASGNGWFLGNARFGSNTAEYYEKNIEFKFFQHYLNNGTDTLARANVFFTGENTWHQLAAWPPAFSERRLYLAGSGGLSFDGASSGYDEYVSDPAKPVPYTEDVHFHRTREYMTDDQRFAARRPDVLVYETAPLTSDLTIAGPIVADLQTSISTTDADYIVKLIDVFPDDFQYPSSFVGNGTHYPMGGYQMLVRGEVMRGRFRKSFAEPVAFKPGEVTSVRYTMPDAAHTFKAGHRIMVQVQSTWFPLVDRNPQQFVDIYHAADSDFVKSTIRIYHSSSIILPVLQ
ncbi:MAG TPA: CocE/NonD family hydrolase [Dinghuibacter sp.]|uniref:CocE/NonD family hydrolase n=1 Tax=Dinghuibacter sp. TaxID=2024697 RepID=UPI002BF5C0EE|nr:CocE/NonD family hydrolase [Dinghuibacter sp.]HTJ10380.1 CocE/NonD family hydrolase [Dinghuibacter sp.]